MDGHFPLACAAPALGTRYTDTKDGKGLYLLVQPSGAKLWRLKYRHGGTERAYAIGVYPQITFAEAREERDRARAWLRIYPAR